MFSWMFLLYVQLMGDVGRARAELQQPRMKLMALTAVQLRAVAKAVLLAPFTAPAALATRWQALFAGNSYQNFLLSEGEQVWAWRNRTENERWFWEVFAIDRWAAGVKDMCMWGRLRGGKETCLRFFLVAGGPQPCQTGLDTSSPVARTARGPILTVRNTHTLIQEVPSAGTKTAWELNPHTSLVWYSQQLHTPDQHWLAAP
jgi:hypothetical protein